MGLRLPKRIRTRLVGRRLVAQYFKSVGIVNDGHLVAAPGQHARHALHSETIAAEVERRIERREETESFAHATHNRIVT